MSPNALALAPSGRSAAPHRARRSAASTGVSPASSRAETSAPSPASALTASPAPFTAAQ